MFRLVKSKISDKLLLTAICILLLLTVMFSTALAEGNVHITVGTAADVQPGATQVSLPVSISNNPGIAGFDFKVTSAEGLTLTSVEKAGILANASTFYSTTATSFVGLGEGTDISGDGVMFNLIFSVDADATAGDYAVSLALTPDGAFCNALTEDLGLDFSAGKITVAAAPAPPAPTAFAGSVAAAPLHDCAEEDAIADDELYTSYALSYEEGLATITAADLQEHKNANGSAGYWVGAAIALPQDFSAYEDIWVAKDDAADLAAAELEGPEYTDEEDQEYITIYLNAATSALETFYFSFDGGETVQYIELDYSGVELYSSSLTGGETLTEGGEYQLAPSATGIITISTTAPVTIVGNGIDAADKHTDLWLNCTQAETDLTIKNLYIYGNQTSFAYDCIGFTGAGNELHLEGVNMIEARRMAGYSLIHVALGTELTIDGDGTLYLYKNSQSTAVGSHYSELNGKITFAGGSVFAKGSMQGAVIGCGAISSAMAGKPGDITISGGELTCIGVSRGAIIGSGAAGGDGATLVTPGDVYISGGRVNFNVDFSGSAIGAGGGGLESFAADSPVYISGGTVRCYVDRNAVDPNGDGTLNLWESSGVTTWGVDDRVITANKMNNPTDKDPVYLLKLNTTAIEADAKDEYTVRIDDTLVYKGGLHAYKFVNEDLIKSQQASISTTPTNWAALDDPYLYVYATGEDHIVTVNDTELSYLWDEGGRSFSLDTRWDGAATTAITPEGDIYTVNTAAELAWVAAQVDAGNSFSGKTISLAADLNLNDKVWEPIGSAANAFAGVFDGAGHEISGLNVTSAAGYSGLFANSIGEIKSFTLRGAVTVSGVQDFVAAVVGFNAGTISDVTSYVTVSAGSCLNVGGIAGLSTSGIWVDASGSSDVVKTVANATGLIQRCANYGSVTGERKVGGIAGENAGAISQCFNSGKIDGTNASSKNGVGGIAGRNGNNNTAKEIATIDSCYNLGTVGRSGQKWVGGMAGFQNSKSTVTNSYVAGTIVAGAGYYNAIVGNQEGAATNCYSFSGLNHSGSAEKEIGITLSETELKAAAASLGDSFITDPNGSYPLLKWQLPSVSQEVAVSGAEGQVSGQVDTLTIEENSVVSIAATTTDGDTNKTALTLAETVATDLGNAAQLTVVTDQASITFDGAALTDISKASEGLSLVTEKLTESADPTITALIDANVPVYEFTLTDGAGQGVWTEAGAGAATVVVPYTLQEGDNPNAIKVFYIANGNKYQVNDAQYFTDESGAGFVRFQAQHFSTYSIENNVQMVSLQTAATSLNANESFTVQVKVATNSANASFNSVFATVNYDAAKLEYISAAWNDSTDHPSVYSDTSDTSDTSGKLKLSEYGDTKTSDENGDYMLVALTFKVKDNVAATASAVFSVSGATIGSDPTGVTSAVTALSGDAITVTVHNVIITLQKGTGVTMDTVKAYAKYGVAGLYTDNTYATAFTAQTLPAPTANASYRLAADTAGEKLWKQGYPANLFTSAELLTTAFTANATLTAQAIQVFDVAFFGADGVQIGTTQSVDKNAFAAAPADPSAAPGMSFAGWFTVSAAGDAYDSSATLYSKETIDAAAVTAKKLYKAYFSNNSYTLGALPQGVTVTGGLDGDGGTTGKATHGTELTFTFAPGAATKGFTFSVLYQAGEGGQVVLSPNNEGVYTIPGQMITGNLTISVELTVDGAVSFIECAAYKGAPSAYKLLLLTLNQENLPQGDKLYKYDGANMFSAKPTAITAYGANGAYVFFVPAGTTSGDALKKITVSDGTTPAVGYDGDVNESGLPEINDAQLVWTLYNGKSNTLADNTFAIANMLQRLQADVNGDGVVDMQDARAVINILNQQ